MPSFRNRPLRRRVSPTPRRHPCAGCVFGGLGAILLGACHVTPAVPPPQSKPVVLEQGVGVEPASPATSKKPDDAPPSVPAPAEPEPAVTKKTASPTEPGTKGDASTKRTDAPANRGPHKVLLLGDSLAATGFGALLEKALDKHPEVDCARRAKSSTGLARPDFFNWLREGKKAVRRHDPELVIVILGGNDGQDLAPLSKGKKRVRWKSEDWDRAYAERVLQFVDGMKAQGRKVLWLGLPKTDTQKFEGKLRTIRAAQQEALAQRPESVTYVDTTPMVVDAQGRVKKKVRHGRRVAALRQRDGIHFTMHGSHYFADQVYPVVLNALGVDPVQP